MTKKKNLFPLQQLLSTANKNIHSTFMRTDNSYFNVESECWPLYKKEKDNVWALRMITDDIEMWKIEDSNEEIESNILNDELNENSRNQNQEEKIQKDTKIPFCINDHNLQEYKFTVNGLMGEVSLSERSSTDHLHHLITFFPDLKNIFTCLVFRDSFKRPELLFLVNFIINYANSKGILLLPESLAICIGLAIPNALVIQKIKNGSLFCIIEDYVLTDTKILSINENIEKSNFTEFNSEEIYIDEFDNTYTEQPSLYLCDLCFEWLLQENGINHVIKMHIKNGKCECMKKKEIIDIIDKDNEYSQKEQTSDVHEGQSVNNLIQQSNSPKQMTKNEIIAKHAEKHVNFVFKGNTLSEKINTFLKCYMKFNISKKQGMHKSNEKNTIIICDEQIIEEYQQKYTNVKFLKFDKKIIQDGVDNLLKIDLAKELWMTDKEWNTTRLRVLKEKLLFNL